MCSLQYILCLDSQTRTERLKKLEQVKETLEKSLKELQERYARSEKSTKKNKMTRESVMFQANKLLGKNKRLFFIKYEKGIVYFSNEYQFEYEKEIAGKFLLTTNTSMEANEVMKSYKQLQKVENAFAEIKNFLDVRPVYHWKEERVKAHVFVCTLSFLIESIIERLSSQSARKVINELGVIKSLDIDLSKKEQ